MPTTTFSEEELIELEILRDEEIDALVKQGFLTKSEQWNPQLRNGFVFTYPEIVLEIRTGERYPVELAEYHLKNTCLPRIVIDDLRVALRRILWEGCQINNLDNWNKRGTANSAGMFEFETIVLQIVAKAFAHLEEFRKNQIKWTEASKQHTIDRSLASQRVQTLKSMYSIDLSNDSDYLESQRGKKDGLMQQHKVDISSAKTQKDIVDAEFGLNPSSIGGHDLANSLLGKTPGEICAKVPEIFRILRIECRFIARLPGETSPTAQKMIGHPLDLLRANVPVETRRELRKRGGAKEKDSLADYLVNPYLTFHGTRRDYVASIVRQGFLIPDAEYVRCGSTYGRGIYSSPSPQYALSYTGYAASPTQPTDFAGLKLLVCATLMGVSSTMYRDDNWRNQTKPYPGSDSHVANEQCEYVVFDQAQILPCYVIHLDLGWQIAEHFEHIPTNPRAWVEKSRWDDQTRQKPNLQFLAPGDKQQIKEALIAKATKYFSYGYGPVSEPKVIIEDVGEVDEDEEEYGEYQAERVEGLESGCDIWMWEDDDTFAVEEMGKGVQDDEDLAINQQDKVMEEKAMKDNVPEWARGVKGKEKFDQYYDARMAKNKRVERPKRDLSP